MFNRVGSKLKTLAVIVALIGNVTFVMLGMVLIANNDGELGFLILIAGLLLSWASALLLYGMGEMVENSVITAENSARLLSLMGGTPYPLEEQHKEDVKVYEPKEKEEEQNAE